MVTERETEEVTFAQRLVELRKEKKITQTGLAEALHVAKGTVSVWERGVRKPEFDTLEDICDLFDVSLGYLLGEVDERGNAPTDEEGAEASLEDVAIALDNPERRLAQLSDTSQRIIIAAINTAYQEEKKSGELFTEGAKIGVVIDRKCDGEHDER